MTPETNAEQVSLAAILCGGKATRMGKDKALLRVDGVPLALRVRERVETLAGRVVAVGGGPEIAHLGIELVPDRYPGANSMGGIATALGYAREHFGEDVWVMVLACDLPFLEPRLLAHLATLRTGHDVVVPRGGAGYEPLCALYRTTCLSVFEDLVRQGNLRIFSAYERVRTAEVGEPELRRFDPSLASFINLNSPEDLTRAQRRSAESVKSATGSGG